MANDSASPKPRFDFLSRIPKERLEQLQNLNDLTSLEEPKPEDGSSGEFTVQSIWKVLSRKGDIILIIDKSDELRLRKQLSAIKAKENFKLKDAGIPTDSTTLEFIEHKGEGVKEEIKDGQIKLQIVLKHKPMLKLHKLIIPKGDLK